MQRQTTVMLSVAVFALVILLIWLPAAAAPLVQLSVIDRDSRQSLPEYPGLGRQWIAGVPGHRYAVRLTNTSNERVLVVLSVDGVNAVNGETADPAQTGYVLAPWQSTEINGWRKSLEDVAQFVFTDVPDSYAARTGRPDNVGVIGIAVFRERQVPQPVYPMQPPLYDGRYDVPRDSAAKAAAPNAEASRAQASGNAMDESIARQRLGTGHGIREWAPVGHTDFVRASRSPAQISELRYDDENALVALGVLAQPYTRPWAGVPQAFPSGFVADPPG